LCAYIVPEKKSVVEARAKVFGFETHPI